MTSWKEALCIVVVLLSLALGQDEQPSDSLRTAIEAVSRRQRDLVAAGPNYYAGALSQYRYQDNDARPGDELAFIATPREFTGDGQPENIGYGYQKTIASPSGMFTPQAPLDGEGPINSEHSVKNKIMEKILVDYLEDKLKDEPEDNDEEPDGTYYRKRSAFRERSDDDRRRFEAMKKREFRSFAPSAFRERTHSSGLVDDVEEKKRKILAEALVRKMEEEEEEERRDRERGKIDDDEKNEEEYLDVLRNVWDKYRKDNPHIIDIEDISEGDVGEIINYLGNTGLLDDDDVDGIKQEASKRDYDFNMHNMAMGGFGHGFKKRWNQRLDGDENQKGSFLYSLKFVSPAINREAIESLKDDDDLELPDERDEDVLRLTSNVRREPDPWFPAFERGEAPEELFGNPGEEEYQRLLLAQHNDHQTPSRKRTASLRPRYRESSPADVFLMPEKKYLYDTAVMKKRYPVTKRSSNFYASPPLLHHKNFAFMDNYETRKKKDATGTSVAGTDPKVARELNQIFSSPLDDHSHEAHLKDSFQMNTEKPQNDTVHVATTHLPATTALSKTKENDTEKINKDNATSEHKLESEEETVEQPVTMSRSEAPLDIKKKSINWSDYFGIDRRRKKTGPSASGGHPIDDDWLLNQYYKTYEMATNSGKKRSVLNSRDFDRSRSTALQQPFDTRVFGTDIFARTAQHDANAVKKSGQALNLDKNEEARLNNMDAKLRNIEDEIVNEAVKYTGAHEGTTDSREIQDVKDKVMARLAAAYSLEKMRQALGEFKSSLMAQKMSKYNPENRQTSGVDEKKKRVAVKKEKAEEKKSEDKKKRGDEHADSEEDMGEFLEGPVIVQPMSEGDMGRQEMNNEDDMACPILDQIVSKCRSADNMVGDHSQLFLPLCSLHQICYLCGPELGAPSPAACDLMFITEAEMLCRNDEECRLAARRNLAVLRRSQDHTEESQCWRSPCIAHYFLQSPLPAPLPASSSR